MNDGSTPMYYWIKQAPTRGSISVRVVEPFIVPTPTPYVVDLATYPASEREAVKASLIDDCEHLYAVLQRLGISLTQARNERLSFNHASLKRLQAIAADRGDQATLDLIQARL